jgi:hypothetical protein
MIREMKRYVLFIREVQQIIGNEHLILTQSDNLRPLRREAKRRGLHGFLIARRSIKLDGSDGAFISV